MEPYTLVIKNSIMDNLIIIFRKELEALQIIIKKFYMELIKKDYLFNENN